MDRNIKLILDLSKYRLSLAVVLSSVTGYFLYSKTFYSSLIFLILGVFLLAAGSASLNQFSESISDSLMARTRIRPIPSNQIQKKSVLIISVILLCTGSTLLAFNGIRPLIIGILTVITYNFLYTSLKKVTVFSILPGAFVGALPPIIGFFSAGASELNLKILCFSGFMFLWQIPHFWLILIKYGKEYSAAGFASLSDYLDQKQIKILVFGWIVVTCIILFVFSLFTSILSPGIAFIIAVLNILFIILFFRFLFSDSRANNIKGAFILINSFSILVMCLIITTSILMSN
jgi:heme o synthase